MTTPHHPTRRDLVLGGGLAAGVTLVAGGAQGQVVEGPDVPNALVGRPPEVEKTLPEPETRRLGWAVAGLGHFATTYQIPALGRTRLSRLVGLVSGNPAKAADIAARTGVEAAHVYTYETFDRVRDDAEIDVVYVITPNSLHRDLVIRALDAGKHVLVEKPMATRAADAEAMLAAAEANDRRLMVAYRAHFEPFNVEAERLIRVGALGEVSYATSDHHRPLDPADPKDQWRTRKAIAGGGSFTDIGIYALNGLIWFMGEPVEALSAHLWSPSGDPRFAEVEAVAAVRLRFASGRLAQISSGYVGNKKRIEVFGAEAVATLDPATEYAGNGLTLRREDGMEDVRLMDGSEVQFSREMDHLSEVILNGGDLRTPAAMGLRDVRLIEAVYASAAEDGAWLRVDPEGRRL